MITLRAKKALFIMGIWTRHRIILCCQRTSWAKSLSRIRSLLSYIWSKMYFQNWRRHLISCWRILRQMGNLKSTLKCLPIAKNVKNVTSAVVNAIDVVSSKVTTITPPGVRTLVSIVPTQITTVLTMTIPPMRTQIIQVTAVASNNQISRVCLVLRKADVEKRELKRPILD